MKLSPQSDLMPLQLKSILAAPMFLHPPSIEIIAETQLGTRYSTLPVGIARLERRISYARFTAPWTIEDGTVHLLTAVLSSHDTPLIVASNGAKKYLPG